MVLPEIENSSLIYVNENYHLPIKTNKYKRCKNCALKGLESKTPYK